jgi:hypothetical protein
LQYIPRCIVIPYSLLIPHFLDGFFHFTSQNTRAFSSEYTSSLLVRLLCLLVH